jgi:hypothetical protein
MAAINLALYSQVIMDNLYKGNPFMQMCTDDSRFVRYLDGDGSTKGAAVVHIPAAGAVPTITQNRSSFPITALNRTDVDLTYNINTYDAGVWYMTQVEAETVAYDKASSLVREQVNALAQTLGNQICYALAPSAVTYGVTRVIRTNGVLQSVALSSGATGSRSGLTLNNVANAMNMLDSDNMPYDERFMVFPSAQWNLEILNLANLQQFLELGSKSGLRAGTVDDVTSPEMIKGYVGNLYGFNCYKRQTVVSYLTGSTPVLQTIGGNGEITATNTTDNLAVLFWGKIATSVAQGETIVFYNPDRAEYLGGLFSAYVRLGAAQSRSAITTGQLGIGAIVQQ